MLYQHIRVMLLLLFPQCSAPCGTGQRSQEVVHVSNTGEIVPDEECSMSGPVMWKTVICAQFLSGAGRFRKKLQAYTQTLSH